MHHFPHHCTVVHHQKHFHPVLFLLKVFVKDVTSLIRNVLLEYGGGGGQEWEGEEESVNVCAIARVTL